MEALKSQKRLQRQEVQRLRGHLGDLKCAEKRGPCRALTLKARPMSQKRADKCREIEISKFQLQAIVDELADATASLEATLRHKDYLKTGLMEDGSER